MFLSSIKTDSSGWYKMHQQIASMFPDERYLFSPVKEGNTTRLSILSYSKPPDNLVSEIIELPENYWQSDAYEFTVVVNPTKCVRHKRETIPFEEQEEWFKKKLQKEGGKCLSLKLTKLDPCECEDKGNKVKHTRTMVTGTLLVTDREKFIHICKNGFGRGKAFGCGFLQVVPVDNYN